MTIDEFRATLAASDPPDGPPLLKGLWHDAKGHWERAHEIAQEIESTSGAWVHAYLHRTEGDLGNAGYWYRRALSMIDGVADVTASHAGSSVTLRYDPSKITPATIAQRIELLGYHAEVIGATPAM